MVLATLMFVVLPAGASVRLWYSGGSHHWVKVPHAPAMGFVMLPLFVPFGVCMLARAAFPDSEALLDVTLVVTVLFLTSTILSVWFGVPKWWGPRWYRTSEAD